MRERHGINTGVLGASLAAGPMFVIATALAWLYLQLPRPLVITSEGMLGLFLLCLPAAAIGFFLAIGPNLVGTAVMNVLGERVEVARTPLVWIVAGSASGALIAFLFGALPGNPAVAFGLIVTSAACARTCRRGACWD